MRALAACVRRALSSLLRWLLGRRPAPSRADLLIGDHVINTTRSTTKEIS